MPATASHDPGSLTTTLGPGARHRHEAYYTAAVTTGAGDEAGTPLDQSPNTAGNRGRVQSFKLMP